MRTHAIGRRTARLVLAVVGLTLMSVLAACTGTQETVRPVLLVVAGEDSVGLVHHAMDGGDHELTWLPAAERAIPGRVVDLAVAHRSGDGTDMNAFVLAREEGIDVMRVFDATGVPVEDAGAFEQIAEHDLSAIVANSDTLVAEALCTRGFDVSPDGRWLALEHAPSACGSSTFVDSVVLLVDLDADPVEDGVVTYADGDLIAPAFDTDGEVLRFVDTFDATFEAIPLPGRSGSTRSFDLSGLDEVVDLGTGGLGRIVVAGSDAIVTFDPVDEASLVQQESSSGIEAVVDASLLGLDAIVLRTSDRLVVHRDATSDEDEDVDDAAVPRIVDAVVGPDRFAYVVAPGSMAIVDLQGYLLDTSDRLTTTGATGTPEGMTPVALDWVYGAFPDDVTGAPRR